MANDKKTQTSVDVTKKKSVKATSNKELKGGNKVSTDKGKKNGKAKSSNKNEKKITTKVNTPKEELKKKNNVQAGKKTKKKIEVEEQTKTEITEEEKTVANSENKKQAKNQKEKKGKKATQTEHQNVDQTELRQLEELKRTTEKTNSKKKEKQEKNQIKIDTKKTVTTPAVSPDEMTRLVKIILILIVIVVAFYGLTVLITKFKKSSSGVRDTTVTPAVIQYDKILIGSLLKQPRDEYYVLIRADDDPYQSLTSYYLTSYENTTDALKVYIANINDGLNSYYVSETSNIRPENMKDFRVSDVTLIYVKNHKITESYEGIEEVTATLKALVDSHK